MPIVARLSNTGVLYAYEFDDNSSRPFNISSESIVFATDIDENTTSSLSGNQRMCTDSAGDLFVLTEINEILNFGTIDTTDLELHLDSIDSQFTTASGLPTGQQLFTSNGTFTVPDDVTSISVVCVGGGGGGGTSNQEDELGGGGGGGALAYVNNITTTPGESLTITVGAGGNPGGSNANGTAGGNSSLSRGGTTLCSAGGGSGGGAEAGNGGAGGTVITGTGGSGGSGGNANEGTENFGAGGGGAGGYSGAGGNGANNNSTAAGGNGAGGAAGGAGRNAGGGGVGILGGELINGLGGAATFGGGGGTGGDDGGDAANGDGGLYGGGGAGADDEDGDGSDAGANGVVRIIWGPSRTFPSDLTGDAVILNTPVWNDLSGNNRHATLLNGANRITTFVKFDGIDDCGKTDGAIGSAYNGVTGTSARTSILYFRVSVPNTDYKPLAWGDVAASGQKWTMAINSSNLMRGEVSGAAIEQPTTHRDNVVNVTDGFWHMVAITAPASGAVNDMRMWIDGDEVTGLTFTNGTQTINTANTNNVAIGASLADAAPQYLDGQLAKVMVYSRELSDFDIKTIYQSLISKFPFSPTTPFGASFNFRYHAFGNAIGTTTFYWYNTTTSTLNELTSIVGQQQTSSNAPWSDIQSIPLDAYAGETGRIVIRYQTGPQFQQDFALDDMQLINTTAGTIDLDPSTTEPIDGWQQQGIRDGGATYPTTGYLDLATNTQNPNNFWQYNDGGTLSNNTGPSADSDGSATGFYIYFEGSGANASTGHNAWLQTSSTYTLN